MYKVLVDFMDLQDGRHVYNAGDTFPRDGVKPSKSRINELLGKSNKIGRQLIEEIKEDKEDADGAVPRTKKLVR